jgi:hypothetical protein
MQEGLFVQSTDNAWNAWPAYMLELTEVARKTRGRPPGVTAAEEVAVLTVRWTATAPFQR